jgi:hypothetical protein
MNNTLPPDSLENKRQVRKLLEVVRDLLKDTKNIHFTDPFLLRSEEIMVQSTARIAEVLNKDPSKYVLLSPLSKGRECGVRG